jgi:hypothetical protein
MAGKGKDWFKARGYLHLDNKITSTDRSRVFRYVSNEKLVARHAFLPLLHKVKTQRRFKHVEDSDKKKNNKDTLKPRPLHYAGHMDSQIYAYYANVVLTKPYKSILEADEELNKCVTAYRRIPADDCPNRNKNNIDFAKEVFDEIKRRGECVAMAFDIESFFTNLDHQLLKERWCAVLNKEQLPDDHYNIFKSVTDFRFININDFRVKGKGFDEKKLAQYRKQGIRALLKSPNELKELTQTKRLIVHKNQRINLNNKRRVGIPQGLPISSILANIYMLPFDRLMVEKVVEAKGAFYRRYSDDIVIVCQVYLEKEISELIRASIQGDDVRLSISEKKTEVSYFRHEKVGETERLQVYRLSDGERKFNVPFAYLGFEFYGYQTLIKSAKIAGFYRRMKNSIKRKNRMAERRMIKELSDKIVIYKTQLCRLYTAMGIRSRNLKTKDIRFEKDSFGQYHFINKGEKTRKYRGNALTYAKRASRLMNEGKILKQYRRHQEIFHSKINVV